MKNFIISRFNRFFRILAMFLLLLTISEAEAAEFKGKLIVPDSTFTQIITLRDGSTIFGRVDEIGETEIKFCTLMGVLTISIDQIEKIVLISQSAIKGGKYWFPNPNSTRLFFAPTGRMLNQGQWYFSDYYILFPGFTTGLTDNITMGAGMSLIPGLSIPNQIFFFTPKIGLKATQGFDLAAGALIIKIPNWEDDEDDEDNLGSLGILYTVGTYGSLDHSLTIGLGYGFAGDQLAKKPMIVLGGETRVSRRVALVTENWIMPGIDNPLISYGVRIFGEKLSVDLALLTTVGEDAFFPGIPYIDFVVNF